MGGHYSMPIDRQALNAALFKGFDEMFDGISYRLGAAVAQVWQSSDL